MHATAQNDDENVNTAQRREGIPPLAIAVSDMLRLRGAPAHLRRVVSLLPPLTDYDTPGSDAERASTLRAFADAGARVEAAHAETLRDIPPGALPCVLLLQDGQACTLLDLDVENGRAKVIFPAAAAWEYAENDAPPPPGSELSISELAAGYAGEAVFALPQKFRDARAEQLRLLKPPHWFWGVLRTYLPLYRDVALASFVVNLLTLASPLFIMNVYDRVVPNNATGTLWMLAIGLLIAHLMDFLLRSLRGYFVDVAGRGADVAVGSRLINSVLNMRLENKPESTGGLVNNLREFEQVRDFFGSTSLLALFDLPFLILFVLAVAYIGGPMAILLLFALPLTLLFVWMVQIPFQRSIERQFKQNMHKNAMLVEIVGGLETIKCCLAQGQMKRRWEAAIDASSAESARSRQLSSLASSGTLLLTYLTNAMVIIMGVYLIGDGKMTQGGLIACVILIGRALGPLMQLAAMLTQMQRSRMALKALGLIVDLPSEANPDAPASGAEETLSPQGPPDIAANIRPDILIEQLRFSYAPDLRPALNIPRLHIRPGEKVGFIGAAGSGKTTLGRLLVGLYQPREGGITLGGVDLRQMDQADLRSRVAMMPQENVLFYGTLMDNITLGLSGAGIKSVMRAAELAGVDEFAKKHPQGYDMPVGERGCLLSGGQRQAVTLARTLLRPADIYILDEPTGNLDMDSEHRLMLRLKTALAQKTLLLMTHRPSLLALVDRLVLLHDGVMIAEGPRNALLTALNDGSLAAALRERRDAGVQEAGVHAHA